MAAKRKRHRRGTGLWEWHEIRSENSVTFTGEVLAGAAIVFVGAGIAIRTLELMRNEREAFGEADPHFALWLAAVALIVIGFFLAHAGVIYWFRRLRGRN